MKKPKWKKGDYCKVWAGRNEDLCFTVSEIRYDEDNERHEYLFRLGPFVDWEPESNVVHWSRRDGDYSFW